MRRLNCDVVFAIVVAFVSGCGQPRDTTKTSGATDTGNSSSEPLVILVAASTKDAIEELAGEFETKTGRRVRIGAGPSNALAAQIASGAPADLFLSANEKWADYIEEERLAEAVTPLLTNDLVLIVPRDNPAEVRIPADLAGPRLKRLALAGENVPAGIYAEQALRALKLYDALADAKRIVRGQDVRMTLGYVARGEAEAGIVYATDARIVDDIAVVYQFNPTTYDRIVYPLVLVKRDRPNAAARKLYDYLRSPEAATVFEKFGFKRVTE
ncbi:MAG: molybdate ABC transporter substrate-binding protein [Pirellulales bacterium]